MSKTSGARQTEAKEAPARADKSTGAARVQRPRTGAARAAAMSDPFETVIGFQLRRAQLLAFQELIERLNIVDLRPAQFALLSVLGSNPGVNQTVAAQILAIKRTNFVTLMDELERRGLAERRISARDRRGRPLHLTAKGKDLLNEAARIQAGHEEELRARLGGDAAAETLLRLLRSLAASTGEGN